MTLFEASFLGLEFTIIRYAVAVPLIALSSEIMGSYLQTREYQVRM
jgi:hypothetical protein